MLKILLSRSVQTSNSDKKWQTSCPLQTCVCHISRHLEFIIEEGHRVGLQVARFPGHWVAGSQNVTQFHVCLPVGPTAANPPHRRVAAGWDTDRQRDGRTDGRTDAGHKARSA